MPGALEKNCQHRRPTAPIASGLLEMTDDFATAIFLPAHSASVKGSKELSYSNQQISAQFC
jgi:hypothetical protein